jgi:lysozyme
MMLTGIDVSAYQHPPYQRAPVDWTQVAKAGHRFAIIKATEGTTYTSKAFAVQRAGARAAGLLVGTYHFARWERDHPEAEAEFYARTIGPLAPGDLPPALDIEWIRGAHKSADELVRWVLRFMERLETLTNRLPLIYTGPSFWRYCLASAKGSSEIEIARYPLWIVDYSGPIDPMRGAEGWRWWIWQHTGHGSCPGVLGDCDLNRFWGGEDELRDLAGLPPRGVA